MKPYQLKYQCLACGHTGHVLYEIKADYQEVTVCPKCKGAFVDVWRLNKYQENKVNETKAKLTLPNFCPSL